MVFTDIIEKKKQGFALTTAEIDFFINGMMDGTIPDYQVSAFLMAVVLKGMDERETFDLTAAMINSGEVMQKGGIKGVCVDKHSTGGVSDSTTLVIVPICCALGLKFAKLSGRGLGHTGGTIDKLESFTGFNVNLSEEQFVETVNTVGGAVSGQTEQTVPADKKLYALRDVTCTVDSIPLIASSIMSKKLSSFADIIALDVKYGSGAFMKTAESAEQLARAMVDIGKAAGRKVFAVITSMNQPLGDSIGYNAEVKGAIQALEGKPSALLEVSVFIAEQLLISAGWDSQRAKADVKYAIESGMAKQKLKEIVSAQGGDTQFIDNPELLSMAKYSMQITCDKGGFLYQVDAQALGNANILLGGGRIKKGDEIDHQSGIIVHARLGDKLNDNSPIATIYTNNKDALTVAAERVKSAFVICDIEPKKEKLIHNLIR